MIGMRDRSTASSLPKSASMTACLTCFWLIAATPSAREPQATYLPQGSWTMAGEDGRCVLSRTFASGQSSIVLKIEPMLLGSVAQLSVLDGARTGKMSSEKIRLGTAAGQQIEQFDAESFDSRDGVNRVRRMWVSRDLLDRAAASGSLVVTSRRASDGSMQLPLPQLKQGMAVLRQCEQAILETVGLPKGELALIAQQAKVPPMMIRRTADEIAEQSRGDQEDFAVARWIVGADGRATSCGLVHRAQSPVLNGQACHAWGPLRFEAAKDSAGKPVRGLAFTIERWHPREFYPR